MYKFMENRKKKENFLLSRAPRESLEISVSEVVKAALISLFIVPTQLSTQNLVV